MTRRLARQLVRDVNAMSIREVARRYDLPWHYIMRLTSSWSDRVAANRRSRRCRVLLIDETSLRRGHHLGHASHVLDRFHVARWFAAGMVEVRRRVQRIGPHGFRPAFGPEVFRSRYLQLTRFDQLPTERVEALGRALSGRPELEAAWRMTQHLYGIHIAADTEEANQALAAFIEAWHDTSLDEFDKLVGTLLEWGDEIFAFHDTDRVTNGRIEGTNNKLGVHRTRHLRIRQHHQLRRQSPPPHPRHANTTKPSDESLIPSHRAEPRYNS